VSNYTEFEKDFPRRCMWLLDDQRANAESENLEVTFLLTFATGMICMIADRIALNAADLKQVRNHSTGKSRVKDRWEEHAETLRESLRTRAEVLNQLEYSAPAIRREGERPDQWTWQPMNPDTSLRYTFSLVRNALAHGNIWTEPDRDGKIVRLVLAAKFEQTKDATNDAFTDALKDALKYAPEGALKDAIKDALKNAPKDPPKRYEAIRLPPTVLNRLLRVWAELFGGLETSPRPATHRNPRLESQ
jgi:hypothetical protein